MNPNYEEIECVPMEVRVRPEIGAVASPDRLDEIPKLIDDLRGTAATWKDHIREIRARWIYNIGTSGSVGASYIAGVAEQIADTVKPNSD